MGALTHLGDCAGEESGGVVDPAVLAVNHGSVIRLLVEIGEF